MTRILAVCLVSLWSAVAAAGAGKAEFRDDFSGKGGLRWRTGPAGDWRVINGKYVNTKEKRFIYRWTVADAPFTRGTLDVDAVIRKKGMHGCTSFGMVAKYIDENNYWRVQFGTYGTFQTRAKVNGKRLEGVYGTLRPEIGKPYHLRLVWKGADVGVYLNGKLLAVLVDPLADKAGKPGLYTATVVEFDNFVVKREK